MVPILTGPFDFLASCISLFRDRTTKDDHNVMFETKNWQRTSPTLCYRLVDLLLMLHFNRLGQLTHGQLRPCEPSLGVDEEAMTATDQLYHDKSKVGEIDSGCFSLLM